MKGLFELRRNSRVKYKPKKEDIQKYYRDKGKKKAKKEHKEAMESKRVICRVLPFVVADNFDAFIELAPISTVHDVNYESMRVKREILEKN
jgi:hypothetical protein